MDEPRSDALELESAAYRRSIGLAISAGVLTLPLALYARSADPPPTSVPLVSSDARLYYWLALLVGIGIGAFAQSTDRDGLPARTAAVRMGYRWIADQARGTAWIVPALIVWTVCLLLGVYHRWVIVLATPILAGSGVFVATLARHYLFSDDERTRRTARIALRLAVFLIAFVMLALIYLLRMRSLLSATAIGLVAALAVVAATEGLDESLRRRSLYAVTTGLLLAEATWAVNYWNAPGWYGGVVLAALLVAVALAVAAQIDRRLDRSLVARLSGVTALVVITVAFVADHPTL